MNDSLTIKEALVEARKLIASVGWTQRGWARNANGISIFWKDPEAVCFCVSAAISRVCKDVADPEYFAANVRYAFLDANGISLPIPEWNDAPGRTQAEVLAAFDKAISEQP